MAAIIAQITRANRERIEKKKFEIIISKCMYEIKPFEGCFDPRKHNKYVAAKKMNQEKEDSEQFYKIVIDRLSEIHQEECKEQPFTWRAFSCELIFIVCSMAFVPVVMAMISLTWPR